MNVDLKGKIAPTRAKGRLRLPVVMSVDETRLVLNQMQGQHLLIAESHYGFGLRLMECNRYWVNNIDTDRRLIYIRFGKRGKDCIVPLPDSLVAKIDVQLDVVRRMHSVDVRDGFRDTWLPEGFARKIGSAALDFGWQYLFPARNRSIDPRSGRTHRQQVLVSGLQKTLWAAVRRVGLTKRVTPHTLGHSYATHLLESGINIRIVEDLMGHADVKTTEIYTHVMRKDIRTVASPLDSLRAQGHT